MRLSSKIKRTISILLTLILLSTTVVHADIHIIDEEDQLIMDESHDLLINDDSEIILSDKSSEDVLIPDDTDVIETLDEAIEDAPGHKSFNILSETDDLLLDTNDGSMEVSPDMDGGSSVKKLQLGHAVLGAGVNTVSAATVYFGSKGDPLAWRVIGYNGSGVASSVNTATLLASGNISTSKFDDSEASSFVYANSRLRTVVDNIYITRFESFEDSNIRQRKLEIGSYINTAPYTDGVAYKAVGSAYLWPLSSKEVYYTNSDLRTASDNWWLRSQGSNSGRAAEVFSDGYVNYEGYNVYSGEGVRPAFNLNFSSIILTSAAENGKPTGSAGTLKAPVDYTGTAWKLTVTDNNLTIAQTAGTAVTRSGNTVTVPYTITGSNAGNATQVSVLITDKAYTEVDAKILYYGALDAGDTLADSETGNGTGTFTLPDGYADKTCGTDYYAYILAEDVNGDHKTDYASTPVSITVPQRPILTISANDITLEYNGQTQGPSDTVYNDPAEIATLVTVTGLLDGDTLTSITIGGQGQDVGDYELTPSQAAISNGSTPVNDKYDIKYVAGTLHIVPIPKNLQLGASALADNAGASGAATVYYGKNDRTWRIIGYPGGGSKNAVSCANCVTLLSSQVIESSIFHSNTGAETDNDYYVSNLKTAVNNICSDTYFLTEEQNAIEKRELTVDEYKSARPYSDGVSGTPLTGAEAPKLWPLSTKEAYTLYNNESGITKIGDLWWLRSPGYFINDAATVYEDGYVHYEGIGVYNLGGVRPAFNINLSSIILTSAAEGGKDPGTPGALTAPTDYTGTDWKLTIKDPSLVINPGNAYKSGNTVTVSYTFTGSPNRISVLITDKDYTANDAKIKYYGAIAEGSSLGKSATFTLPGDVADTDKLYLLAETVNGNKKTDLASVPQELTVSDAESISDATVSLDKTSLVYNGSQQSVSVNSVKLGDKILTAGTDYTVSGNLAGTNANTYSVTVTGIGNYKDSKIVTWDITRKPVTVSANSLGKVYGSNNPVLTATVTGTIGTDTVSYTLSRAAGENVNTYTITPNIAAQIQGNYSVSGVTGTFTITRKPVTITAKNQTVALNGNIVTGTSQVNIDGLVSGDELSGITLTSSSTASATTSGTITPGNAVIKKGTTDVTANYQMTYQNGKLTVNKGTVTYIAPTAKTLIYNGNAQALVNAGSVTSAGAKMLYSLSQTGTYSETVPTGTNAGPYTVWYKVDGGPDYTDVDPTGIPVTVSKKPVTIKALDQSVSLSGNIVSDTSKVSASGLLTGHQISAVTLTGTSTAHASDNGTITPGNAKIVSGTTDVTANYQITYQNGKQTVNKGTVTYTAPTAKTLTYNGKEQTLVNAGIVSSNGAKMLYSLSENGVYGEEIPAAKESGSYKVWYRIDGGTDYEDVAPASVDVTIKPLPFYSVSVTDDGHGYGTASPSSGNAGTLITISASADQGYSFKEWQVVSGSVTLKDSKKADTTFTLGNSDVTIKAVFKKKSSPSPSPYTPPYNPPSDSSGGSGDDIASGSSSGSQRNSSFDYLNELRVKLAQAVAANKEQTIYWDKGIMLPYDIMKSLQDHPKITLIFFYNYQGFNYLTCIPGKNVKANPAIPWYGPVYLFLYYGINAVPVSVPGASLIPTTPINTYVVQKGDTLSKIAVRIGKSVNHLVTTNGIKNKNLIKVGQVLRY